MWIFLGRVEQTMYAFEKREKRKQISCLKKKKKKNTSLCVFVLNGERRMSDTEMELNAG